MEAVVVGYGYTAKMLLNYLAKNNNVVHSYSRQLKETPYPVKQHLLDLDLQTEQTLDVADKVVFYLIPPPEQGHQDLRVKTCIDKFNGTPKAIVYFSSSFIYGDHQGDWIDETAKTHLENDRSHRRHDAEKRFTLYAQKHEIPLSILRSAGIYGPNRFPISRVRQKAPVLRPEEAPFSNHIHVDDLALVAYRCAQTVTGIDVFNVADGDPHLMGSMQRIIADFFDITLPESSFIDIFKNASPTYREFMSQSKRLTIDKLKQLDVTLQYPDFKAGLTSVLALYEQANKTVLCAS